MSIKEHKAVVLRFLQDVWGEGNLDLVDDLVAKDHVHHLPSKDVRGPEGVKRLVTGVRTFMPDIRCTVSDVIAEGDRVVVYFVLSGTDTGGHRGRPPSGNPVSYQGIDIFRLSGGMIVERWGIIDTISLLRQIHAIP